MKHSVRINKLKKLGTGAQKHWTKRDTVFDDLEKHLNTERNGITLRFPEHSILLAQKPDENNTKKSLPNSQYKFIFFIYYNDGYNKYQIFEHVDFVCGSAYTDFPTIQDLVHCLFSDYQCGSSTFKEFCDTFGYSDDSIKAQKTYFACQENGEKLKKIMGSQFSKLEKFYEDY